MVEVNTGDDPGRVSIPFRSHAESQLSGTTLIRLFAHAITYYTEPECWQSAPVPLRMMRDTDDGGENGNEW